MRRPRCGAKMGAREAARAKQKQSCRNYDCLRRGRALSPCAARRRLLPVFYSAVPCSVCHCPPDFGLGGGDVAALRRCSASHALRALTVPRPHSLCPLYSISEPGSTLAFPLPLRVLTGMFCTPTHILYALFISSAFVYEAYLKELQQPPHRPCRTCSSFTRSILALCHNISLVFHMVNCFL